MFDGLRVAGYELQVWEYKQIVKMTGQKNHQLDKQIAS